MNWALRVKHPKTFYEFLNIRTTFWVQSRVNNLITIECHVFLDVFT